MRAVHRRHRWVGERGHVGCACAVRNHVCRELGGGIVNAPALLSGVVLSFTSVLVHDEEAVVVAVSPVQRLGCHALLLPLGEEPAQEHEPWLQDVDFDGRRDKQASVVKLLRTVRMRCRRPARRRNEGRGFRAAETVMAPEPSLLLGVQQPSTARARRFCLVCQPQQHAAPDPLARSDSCARGLGLRCRSERWSRPSSLRGAAQGRGAAEAAPAARGGREWAASRSGGRPVRACR